LPSPFLDLKSRIPLPSFTLFCALFRPSGSIAPFDQSGFFNLGKELQPLNRADKLKMTKKNLKNLKTLVIFNCLA
jgi:hypothetical protein